jgi:hypothetical protein
VAGTPLFLGVRGYGPVHCLSAAPNREEICSVCSALLVVFEFFDTAPDHRGMASDVLA